MKRFLFISAMGDLKYFNAYRTHVASVATALLNDVEIISFAHLKILCASKQVTHIATTSFVALKYFNPLIEGTATENQGAQYTKDGLTITLLPPLKSMHTQNSGPFLLKHYTQKLINPEKVCIKKGRFSYSTVDPSNLPTIEAALDAALLVAVDIETSREPLRMTSIAYTALMQDGTVHSYQIPHEPNTYPFCMDATRILNRTKAPKIMQNGMYDSVYFLMFDAPLYN